MYSAEKTRHFWVKFPTPARQGFPGHGRPNACGLPVGMFKLRINRCILSGLNCQWYFRWLKLNHISIVTCLHKRVRSAINCMVSFDEGELSHPWPKGDAFLSFHTWGKRNDLPKVYVIYKTDRKGKRMAPLNSQIISVKKKKETEGNNYEISLIAITRRHSFLLSFLPSCRLFKELHGQLV